MASGTTEVCSRLCGGPVSSCKVNPQCTNTSCTYGLVCSSPCAVDGRRYTGLDDREAPTGDTVGSYLARMAFFEAASVDAFALLADELATHDAPRSLIRACRVAKHDEVRHARMARTLAKRHGGVLVEPPAPSPAKSRDRAHDLEAIATENAVEGCVRETFGVLIGMWQAEAAPTAELRAFFGAITQDELRHAALSMRIDAWLRSQLSPEAIERVDGARAHAIAALEASFLEHEPPAGLGLPSNAQGRALLASLLVVRQPEPEAEAEGRPRARARPRRTRVDAHLGEARLPVARERLVDRGSIERHGHQPPMRAPPA